VAEAHALRSPALQDEVGSRLPTLGAQTFYGLRSLGEIGSPQKNSEVRKSKIQNQHSSIVNQSAILHFLSASLALAVSEVKTPLPTKQA
jgi:hypothetical protein